MKFGKELEQTAVPEWRGKYLDYKQAKKKLKALSRAKRTVERNTPAASGRKFSSSGTFNPSSSFRNVFSPGREYPDARGGGGIGGGQVTPWSSLRDAPVYSFLNPRPAREGGNAADEPRRGGNERNPEYSVQGGGSRPRRRSEGVAERLATTGPSSGRSALRPVDETSPLRLHEQRTPSLQIPGASRSNDEGDDGKPPMTRYGSIIGSPPSGTSPMFNDTLERQASLLELPDPAMELEGGEEVDGGEKNRGNGQQTTTAEQGQQLSQGVNEEAIDDRPLSPSSPDVPARPPPATQLAHRGNAYEIRQPIDQTPPPLHRSIPPSASSRRHFSLHQSLFSSKRAKSLATPQRTYSNPDIGRPAFMKRIASFGGPSMLGTLRENGPSDVALEAYREVDFRKAEFFHFLDKSLNEIERFYQEKEDEARERLGLLREQLHIMRNQRVHEVKLAEKRQRRLEQQQQHHDRSNGHTAHVSGPNDADDGDHSKASGSSPPDGARASNADDNQQSLTRRLKNSIVSQTASAVGKVRPGHVGKTSKAMRELGTPSLRPDAYGSTPDNSSSAAAAHRDYERRTPAPVSYRVAKRRLKLAMVEYYRGLELLKSYSLLNRKAFQKINKKYDKTVNARPKLAYMAEKVNTAHFTNSNNVDGFIQDAEDLYARYFERGNHKVAVSKLRAKGQKAGQYSGNMFRTGSMGAAGIVLAILALIRGVHTDLNNPNAHTRDVASYLLQVYAGYFLLLLLVVIFCIDARAFDETRVNYKFVFEFDTRSVLDWRQLSEMPALFGFILGLVMYLNFNWVGGPTMYIYWPVVLIGLSLLILFFPPPFLHFPSRKWFLESMWRLLLAGLYPVEFRDFFLGDMFCSQTYAMGNIELFFCLYARGWSNPQQCNSSNSRLFGFFQTWPGIWRALQCVRRFRDSKMIYPHMVNFLKYTFTILSYMSLSLFRIDRTYSNLSLFIAFSSINSFFCIYWDIVNDWSLGNYLAKHPLLRHRLNYKWYWYYLAIVIDIILRCNWIFYVIFKDDIQHSTIVSFAISLSEVCRRGIWVLFRVENEHNSNVTSLRASRDAKLPYILESAGLKDTAGAEDLGADESATARPADEESAPQGRMPPSATPSAPQTPLRRWQDAVAQSPVTQALKRVGTTILSAHAQDYQRKKLPETSKELPESDDDDDDDDDHSSDDEDVGKRRERDRRREELAAEEEHDEAEEEFREQARWGVQPTSENNTS